MKKFIPFYGIHVCLKQTASGELKSNDPMYTLTALYHGVICALTFFKLLELCVNSFLL